MTTNGRLEGKVVLVNGGARGIGAAAVRRMAREGAVLSVQDDAAAHGGPMVRASALVIAAGADLVAAIGFVSASLESVFFRSSQFPYPASRCETCWEHHGSTRSHDRRSRRHFLANSTRCRLG